MFARNIFLQSAHLLPTSIIIQYLTCSWNLNNMNWLQEIFADSDSPDNLKKNRKVENIWKKGRMLAPHAKPPNLKNFPNDNDIVISWDKGFRESQLSCRNIGINPETAGQTESQNYWFFAYIC